MWTCKSTGKSNLTYEEALVSEKQANEKVQQFPKELMEPVLRDVQFSNCSFYLYIVFVWLISCFILAFVFVFLLGYALSLPYKHSIY